MKICSSSQSWEFSKSDGSIGSRPAVCVGGQGRTGWIFMYLSKFGRNFLIFVVAISLLSTLFEWCLIELLPGLEDFNNSQRTLSKYRYNGKVYMTIHSLWNVSLGFFRRLPTLAWKWNDIFEDIKPTTTLLVSSCHSSLWLNPPKLCWITKSAFFEFTTLYKPQLHDRHKIVRSDIKLSNMLLNGLRLWDLGVDLGTEIDLRCSWERHLFHGD